MLTIILAVLKWSGIAPNGGWEVGAMWYMVAPLCDGYFLLGVLVHKIFFAR